MSTPETPAHRSVIQPQYQKLGIILLGLIGLFLALSVTSTIVVPLLFALLLAMLLNPLVNGMTRIRMPRTLAITLAVLLAMLALAGLSYFIVSQAIHFGDALPQLKEKVNELIYQVQGWAQEAFDMKRREMDEAVEKVKDQGTAQGGSLVGQTLNTVGTLFGFFFLLPVFTFLLLLYKQLLITFVAKLFPRQDHDILGDVLTQTKSTVQSYLIGLMMEAGIVTVLNWIGLTIIGVPYALLLAVIGAVLNLIPYIGMIIATILPMLLALATLEPVAALWVLGLYLAVQFIDNNFIVPKVVASRVELNALVSILVVMAGGLLWGIPGMFLAIPITAMLKVIFDRVPALEPFGYVLGDGGDQDHRTIFRLDRFMKKHERDKAKEASANSKKA
jgi:predicted PurR-regulated permease PerM